jgi:5'-nucleotidase / UDP-sugar diphosphatase
MHPSSPVRVVVLTIGLLVILSLLTTAALAQSGEYTLTIIHTNDTHAHLQPITSSNSDCSAADDAAGKCFGGLARRATVIQRLRAEAPNSILVDAGDQFQGTLFYFKYKGDESKPFLNSMGYQALTLGNHEFDDGPANLGRFLNGLNAPMVSANVDVSKEPALAGLLKPYTVLQAGGEKIGVTGCTTTETRIDSSPGPNVMFNDIASSVAAQVAELQKQSINKIILLCHDGYAEDLALAAKVDGIDVIVGGHSHTYLSNNAPDKDSDKAYGPYPTVVKSPAGNPVLVVQAYAYSKYVGRLDVTFDAQGVPAKWNGKPVLLDASVPPDPKVAAAIADLEAPLLVLRKQVVGKTTVALDGTVASCRFGECTMGDLVADAMLWKMAPEGVQIALVDGGSVRAGAPAGDITVGDVLTVLPFGNTIAEFGLRGADLLTALENGVSRAEKTDNSGTGRFPQVAGLRYVWNPNQPVGTRIVRAEVRAADGSYRAVDPNATYKIAALDFARQGGDDYAVFATKAINPYDFGPTVSDVVIEYLAKYSPITIAAEGRIQKGDK